MRGTSGKEERYVWKAKDNDTKAYVEEQLSV
jgi:hypothetical protein